MRWYIQEGFYLEHLSREILSLNYEPDGTFVSFTVDDIDDLTDALRRAKSKINTCSRKAEELNALTRWGQQRTPTDEA